MKKQIALIMVLAVLAIIITSCVGTRGSSRDGLSIRVLNPPRYMYYTGEGDEYPLQVELKTYGESMASGALYIYGYSPDIIDVEGVLIGEKKEKDFRVSFFKNQDFWGTNWCMSSKNLDQILPLQEFNIFMGSNLEEAVLIMGGKLLFNINENIRIPIDFGFHAGDTQGLLLGFGPLTFDIGGGKRIVKLGNIAIGNLEDINLEDFAYGNIFVPIVGALQPIKALNGRFFLLKGRNQYNPAGDQTIETFNVRIKGIPLQAEEVKQTIGIRACYAYVTDAFVDECIDPDYRSEIGKESKPCRFREVVTPKNTIGPIKITKIEQHISKDKLYITMYIQKTGRGIIWNPFSLAKCSPYYPSDERIEPDDQNRILLGEVFMGSDPTPMECRPSRIIPLDEHGRGVVTCTYNLKYDVRNAYVDQLFIELWYGYQQDIFVPVVIRNY